MAYIPRGTRSVFAHCLAESYKIDIGVMIESLNRF